MKSKAWFSLRHKKHKHRHNGRKDAYNLIPRVFVPLDQRSGDERHWKDLTWSPKILDFWLNCTNLPINTWLNRDASVFLPLIFIVFKTNQNWACNVNSRESLVSSSLRSKERRLEERDWDAHNTVQARRHAQNRKLSYFRFDTSSIQ